MLRRIQNELVKAQSSEVFKLYARAGTAEFTGPYYATFTPKTGTYSNQLHLLQIQFSYGYSSIYNDHIEQREFPKNPPLVRFITGVYHPNISIYGYICVDILDENWNPMNRLEAIINSIILLLEEPNINSPLNCDAANQLKTNKAAYTAEVARHYVAKNKKNVTDPDFPLLPIMGCLVGSDQNEPTDLSELVATYVRDSFVGDRQVQ